MDIPSVDLINGITATEVMNFEEAPSRARRIVRDGDFVCMSLISRQDPHVFLMLKLDPASVALGKGFSRDVTSIGHWGTGDLELTLRTPADFEKAKALIARVRQLNAQVIDL